MQFNGSNLCTTRTVSANHCADWRTTCKTEQAESTRLSASVSPAWGEMFAMGEKQKAKNELKLGLHAFLPIACLLSPCIKVRILSQ